MRRLLPLLLLSPMLGGCDIIAQEAENRAVAAIENQVESVAADFNIAGLPGTVTFEALGLGMIPGGEITGVNVGNVTSGAPTVELRFTAPMTPDAARAWFTEQLAAKQVQVEQTANLLTGVAQNGANFRIAFDPAGTGTSGRLEIVPPAQ